MTNSINNTNHSQEYIPQIGQKRSACGKKELLIFDAIDKDKNGVISKEELEKCKVKGKVKNAKGKFIEKQFFKIQNLEHGRSLVMDANGNKYIMSHDGIILKNSYIKQSAKEKRGTTNTALKIMIGEMKDAQKAFDKQMEDDGWAGDLADGISILWNSDNRASKVRKDLKAYKENLTLLTKAAKNGEAGFKAKFKEIFGVEYNQNAIDKYAASPTLQNYKAAFGTKNNIRERVLKYNQSQQTGAEVVKTTAKIGAGVTIGVVTGGTGLAALGVAATGTAASSVLIEESDRYHITTGKGFRKGTDHKKIIKDALWDGASVAAGGAVAKASRTLVKGVTKGAKIARATVQATGDVAAGAAQEYAQTGEVSLSGTLTNAAFGAVGIASEAGAFKKLNQGAKKYYIWIINHK